MIIPDAVIDRWAGRPLTKIERARLMRCIPHSTIPDTIGAIVEGWDDDRSHS